eukprot:TRINITY_DN7598_c0_g2_i2.p1 TRINITY_DN7598_c0_g2~~TRINITY_DN7598_c0_g2_i2.p1  ORF type:complete len:709 (+),score=220.16 TRINITY_DN7598_c0_g2_i2:79-2127(+)
MSDGQSEGGAELSASQGSSPGPGPAPTKVVDTTGDGQPDTLLLDTTGDGMLDTALPAQVVDTTGDGLADAVAVDTTGDGRLDTAVPLGRGGSANSAHSWASAGSQGRRVHGAGGRPSNIRLTQQSLIPPAPPGMTSGLAASAGLAPSASRRSSTHIQADAASMPRQGSGAGLSQCAGTAASAGRQGSFHSASGGRQPTVMMTREQSAAPGLESSLRQATVLMDRQHSTVPDQLSVVPADRRASNASSRRGSVPQVQRAGSGATALGRAAAGEAGAAPPVDPGAAAAAGGACSLQDRVDFLEEQVRNLTAQNESLQRLRQGLGESSDSRVNTLREELRHRAQRVRELEELAAERLGRIKELEGNLRQQSAKCKERDAAARNAEQKAKRLEKRLREREGSGNSSPVSREESRNINTSFVPNTSLVFDLATVQKQQQQQALLAQARDTMLKLRSQSDHLQGELAQRDATIEDLRGKLAEARAAILANVDGMAELDGKLQQSRRALRWILNSQGRVLPAAGGDSREASPAADPPRGGVDVGSPPSCWEPPYNSLSRGASPASACFAPAGSPHMSPPPPAGGVQELLSHGQNSIEQFRARLRRLHDDVAKHAEVRGDLERRQRQFLEQAAEEVRRGAMELQREAEALVNTAGGSAYAAVSSPYPAGALRHPTLSVLQDVERMLATQR